MALDIKYCYSRPELKAQSRISLMNYLERRYGVPRSDSQAPPNYTGEFTADLKNPEAVTEAIWIRYQEEGVANKKSLSGSALRPPAGSVIEEPEPRVDMPDEPPVETKEEVPMDEPETTDPEVKSKRAYRKKVSIDIPVSTPAVDLQPVLTAVEDITKNIGILAGGIQDGLLAAENERKQLKALLNLQSRLTKDIILPTLSWLVNLSAHAVGEVRGDYEWEGGKEKLAEVVDTLTGMIDDSLDTLAAIETIDDTDPIEDLYIEGGDDEEEEEQEEEEEEVEEKSKRSTKQPPGKSGIPPRRIQGLTVTDQIYTLEVEGKELNFSMADLTDKEAFPNALLDKMGATFGIPMAPLPRVKKISTICDHFTD